MPDTDTAQAIFTGTRQLLADHGLTSLTEITLPSGLRADIVAWDHKGIIHIIEVKSGLADFRADQKWPAYRAHCDHFHFAVDAEFPLDHLPDDTGLIVADAHGGAFLKPAPGHPVAAARRKKLLILLAHKAAERLRALEYLSALDQPDHR